MEGPLKGVIKNLFHQWTGPEHTRNSALVQTWPEIAGQSIAAHTKARFLANGDVSVWVDDSSLAFELNVRYKPGILKRLQNQFGEDQVKDVRFFVGQLRS